MRNREELEAENRSEGLANLFDLALQEAEETDSRSPREIYQELILHRVEEGVDSGADLASGWTIAEIWNEPQPSVDRLMRIKCFAKHQLLVSERSCYPEEVVAFVHWVTCAVAWERLGARLSGLPETTAHGAWRWCHEHEWASAEIGRSLTGARRRVGWDSALRVEGGRAESV